MDYICPANLFSISSCDLNTKFNDRCHADWSPANLISFVTLDGIYILKPQLEKLNTPFEIELIKNPADKFRHAPFERNGLSFDDIWNTLDNRQYMDAFLDPAILTNVTKISNDAYPRLYRSAKWSPIIETYPKQCLLAVLTVDYQLSIYIKEHGVWSVAHDLSRAYDDLWMQTPILSGTMTDSSFDGMRRNLHSLSFGTVCWKESKGQHQYLLSTTLTGDIVIWQIDLSNDDETDFQESIINFTAKLILRTNQNFINSMQFWDNLCIVSTRNGQVNLYDLNVIFDELSGQNMQQHGRERNSNDKHVPTFAIIDLAPAAILWHQDNIEVADFYLQSLNQDTFRTVLAKATNICWCTVRYKSKTESEQASLAISDSFSAIDGLDPEVSLHQTSATWLRPAGDKKAVLVADDGSFFRLEFVDDRQDTSPSFNAIGTGKVDLIDMIPRGLCTSPNGHLVTMISSVTFLVDPIKIPAPTKLILLPTINDGKFFNDCFRYLLDENWLMENKIRSPMDVRDLIDSVLSTFPHLNHHQYMRLHMLLKDEIGRSVQIKTSEYFVKLKIISFIISKLVGLDGFKQADEDPDADLEKNVYNIILLDNIEQILSTSLKIGDSGDRLKGNRLSNDQVNSVRNCMSWLDKSAAGQQIRDKYKGEIDELISSIYKQVPYETCSICQCDIPFESCSYGTCTNKHQFSRCSRSLLVLDYSIRDKLHCVDCGRSYLTKLIWPTNNLWLCLYCQ